MDFLDPKKQRRHAIILYFGYALIAVAVVISTLVLVYQATGFGVKDGQLVQNGLVFISSQPNPATIRINGTDSKYQTNTRLSLAEGAYKIGIHRDGYRDWNHTVVVQGGDVQHYDYPFLFPTDLVSKNTLNSSYAAAPASASQSRDKRWLAVQKADEPLSFDIYDLKNPSQAVQSITLPTNSASDLTTQPQTWQVVQWADDNQHFLAKHGYGDKSEYIIVDRQNADTTQNLNTLFGVNPSAVTLIDNKYDRYELFDSSAATLSTANLKDAKPTEQLSGVLAYKTYGSNSLLYATATDAPAGKVNIMMLAGSKTYLIRQVPANTTYAMDMAEYSGTPYVVVAAASENVAYVYKDPIGQLTSDSSLKQPAAVRALRVAGTTSLSFSPNAQFIMAEGSSSLGVYDVFKSRAYQYALPGVLDAPQTRAAWMDGNRISYVSGGKLLVFDYDKTNRQTLMSAAAQYMPFYSPDYHYVYALTAQSDNSYRLLQTGLLLQADL